jgi:DNA-binding FrmR family transcriptional regulator
MKKMTTDEKLLELSIQIDKKIDSKIDELAGMIARGFTEIHNQIHALTKSVDKTNRVLENHMKRSEKEHTAFNKRINVVERLQNI